MAQQDGVRVNAVAVRSPRTAATMKRTRTGNAGEAVIARRIR